MALVLRCASIINPAIFKNYSRVPDLMGMEVHNVMQLILIVRMQNHRL